MSFALLGLALFGIGSLLQKTMPRWNGLPFLAGIWVPLNTIWVTISELSGGRWVEWPMAADMALLLVTFLGLAGLGYLLQSDSQPAGRAAVAV